MEVRIGTDSMVSEERESLEEEDELQTYQRELVKEPMVTMDDVYAKETGRQQAPRHLYGI